MSKALGITIPAKYLAALRPLAAKNDVRTYLNGICLEVRGNNAYLIATNGKTLGCFHCAGAVNHPLAQGEVISILLPYALYSRTDKEGVLRISITTGDDPQVAHKVTIHSTRSNIYITSASVRSVTWAWRDTIPKQVSGEPARINATLLAPFVSVRKTLFPRSKRQHVVTVTANGKRKAALVDIGYPNFAGVIMPLDLQEDTKLTCPYWVKGE